MNVEGVPTASDYYYAKLGKPNPNRTSHFWSADRIRALVNNPIVLSDIRYMASLVVDNEEEARSRFLAQKEQVNERQTAEVEELEAKLSAVKQDERDAEEFIRRLKKYTDVQELTREMAL